MAIVKDAEFTEAIETTDNDQQLQIPSELPVLPLRDIVIYPFMIVPLFVSREKSIRAVDEALAENRMILLASQKDHAILRDRKSTRLNSSHLPLSRMPSS